MTKRVNVPYLSLVPDPPNSSNKKTQTRQPIQLSLFLEPTSTLLGFFNIASIPSGEFIAIIRATRPNWLFDLRPAAVFDLDPRFSRRRAFSLFREVQAIYRDIARDSGIEGQCDARFDCGELSQRISSILEASQTKSTGPIVFLFDDRDMLTTAVEIMPKTLTPRPRGGWHPHIFNPGYSVPLQFPHA